MIEKCNTCKYSKNSYCTHPDTDNKNACMLSDAYPYWEPIEIIKSCENCGNMDETCSMCTDCRDFSEWKSKEIPLTSPACPTSAIPETAPKNNVQEDKAKMSLLPMDLLKKYLVPAYEEGIIKYHRESWRAGFKTSDMVDAAMRHIEEFYWGGQDIDRDSPTSKHHLSGVIFSCLCILHTLDTRPELDDRPSKEDADK